MDPNSATGSKKRNYDDQADNSSVGRLSETLDPAVEASSTYNTTTDVDSDAPPSKRLKNAPVEAGSAPPHLVPDTVTTSDPLERTPSDHDTHTMSSTPSTVTKPGSPRQSARPATPPRTTAPDRGPTTTPSRDAGHRYPRGFLTMLFWTGTGEYGYEDDEDPDPADWDDVLGSGTTRDAETAGEDDPDVGDENTWPAPISAMPHGINSRPVEGGKDSHVEAADDSQFADDSGYVSETGEEVRKDSAASGEVQKASSVSKQSAPAPHRCPDIDPVDDNAEPYYEEWKVVYRFCFCPICGKPHPDQDKDQ